MLHANEAWRQLTGAELQKGVSTGLWESFEFISAQALVRLCWCCHHCSALHVHPNVLSVSYSQSMCITCNCHACSSVVSCGRRHD